MPSHFFDSSAIVKRYHREAGSDWVRATCESRARPPIYLSQLAEVEVIAALRRTGHGERLHPSYSDAMVNMFERHVALSDPARARPMYIFVPISPVVIALAAALCNRYAEASPYPIRSLDAIQLACALAAAIDSAEGLLFVTADVRLAAIAPLEGFSVIQPAYPPHP